MNRQTRNRDIKLKTIKPGLDTSVWGVVKKMAFWMVLGCVLWGGLTYAVIRIINYRVGG